MIGHRAQCSQYPNAALPRFQHLPSSMHSQVDVSVPNSLATSSHPCPLRLEMWQQDTLLCDSCMLLLPSSMLDVAAELHCLPRTTSDDGNECVTLYVADLANWLHFYHLSNMSSTSSPSTEQWRTSAWGVGVLLVRQAVLWGMPALSTLLVDSLMALPPASLPPSPFAQLAQAHNSSASEDVTVHLGGLLHLSLLSPNSTSMMWVVLDWGRRFGGQGGQGRSEEDSASAADRNAAEAGSFAWCWEERNAADQQTPLDLLAALPQGAAAVQHLLEDPLYEPSVQHAKSLARAHGVPPKTSITTTTSLPPSSGKERASSAGAPNGSRVSQLRGQRLLDDPVCSFQRQVSWLTSFMILLALLLAFGTACHFCVCVCVGVCVCVRACVFPLCICVCVCLLHVVTLHSLHVPARSNGSWFICSRLHGHTCLEVARLDWHICEQGSTYLSGKHRCCKGDSVLPPTDNVLVAPS
jgi:hypothetical protein